MFDLRDDPKGRYRFVKIDSPLTQFYQTDEIPYYVANVWETGKDRYWLVCLF
jgi:hypothetical protein